MEYVQKVLEAFWRGEHYLLSILFQKPNALKNSLFARLPREVLGLIFDSLSISSAVVFSLCCRQFYTSGPKYIDRLMISKLETTNFLKLLEKDLPDQIACRHCRTLHKMVDAEDYNLLGKCHSLEDNRKEYAACLIDDSEIGVFDYMNADFSTTVFKMLAKHHGNSGKDEQSRKFLTLLSGKIFEDKSDDLHHIEKSECRIQDGSLFICKRVVILGACSSIVNPMRTIIICPHISLVKGEKSRFIGPSDHSEAPNATWEMFLHCDTGMFTVDTTSNQCQWCRTEYTASFEPNSTCDFELKINTWKDLGPGTGDDPLEGQLPVLNQLWKLYRNSVWEPQYVWHEDTPVKFAKGEISEAFESGWPGRNE